MSDSPAPGGAVFSVGDVIADRFKIVEPLGSSEGGQAYLAMETERNRRMVLKHLLIPWVGDEAYEALREEVKRVSAIRHKNLVQVFGLGKEGEHIFLAMEFVEGQTLASHLEGRREKGQVMGLKAAYSIMAHLCNALTAVHEGGAVHAALTPRNIYVTPQGRVKVTNLVYGQLVSKALVNEKRGAWFDSPFIAPEVKDGDGEPSPAADVFSLALLTCELLADTSLEDYDGEPREYIEAIAGGASADLQELLFSAVLPVPHVRPQDVREFKTGLKAAVDAPGDAQISSVVVSQSDLVKYAAQVDAEASAKKDLFDLDDLPPPPGGGELFESGAVEVVAESGVAAEDEIWLVSRDGLDYGPFGAETVIEMLYKDEINEHTSVLNMLTQRRADLVAIPEFRDKVLAYVPERDARLAREAAERERKIEQVKTGAKVSVGAMAAAAVVIIGLSVFAYLQLPDPVPTEFGAAVAAFPHTFEVPKVEEVTIAVDTSKAMAIFDPAASEAAREAALNDWAAEHQKRIAEKRKAARKRRGGRKRNPAAGGGQYPDQMDDLSEFQELNMATDENGNVLEPLDDWEVEEQLYSSRSFRKQSECFQQHSSSKSKVVIQFTIVPTGSVRNVSTNVSGGLDGCLKSIFRGMRFREFGGTAKKVSYPIEFG